MRTLAFLALLLAGVAILIAVSGAKSAVGRAYVAVPQSAFVSLAPDVPGSSGCGACVPGGTILSGTGDPRELAHRRPSEPGVSPATPPSARPTPRPPRTVVPVGPRISGVATWFCAPPVSGCTVGYPASGMFAAAGPALRVGDWRGRYVTVTYRGQHIVVQLVDFCACRGHLIDLYSAAFSRLAAPSVGVLEVVVSW